MVQPKKIFVEISSCLPISSCSKKDFKGFKNMKKKHDEFSKDIFILPLYDRLLLGIQTAYVYICSINQTLYILSNTSSKISTIGILIFNSPI